MNRTSRQVARLSWILATRWSVTVAVSTLVVSAVVQVRARSRDAMSAFGPTDGLLTAVDLLRIWLPALVLTLAATWVGEQLTAKRRTDAFLAGDDPRRIALAAATAASLVGLATATLIGISGFAAGQVWAHTSRPLPGADLVSLAGADWSNRIVCVLVLPILWSFVGAAMGCLARSGVAAAAAAGLTIIALLLLERLAVMHPVALDVHRPLPLGASNAVALGLSVPGMDRSTEALREPTVIALAWFGLSLFVMFLARWQRLFRQDSAQPAAKSRWRLAAPTVAVMAISFGYAMPHELSERIPWRYQATWRGMVAEDTTPADIVEMVIRATARGDLEAVRASVNKESATALIELRHQLAAASGEVDATNVLDAPKPGSVVVDLGEDQIGRDGEVIPATQWGLCLHRSGGRWVIVDLSLSGVTCE